MNNKSFDQRLADYKDTEGIVDPEDDEVWKWRAGGECPICGTLLTPDDEGAVCENCGFESDD